MCFLLKKYLLKIIFSCVAISQPANVASNLIKLEFSIGTAGSVCTHLFKIKLCDNQKNYYKKN